jgi:hypothetical protein
VTTASCAVLANYIAETRHVSLNRTRINRAAHESYALFDLVDDVILCCLIGWVTNWNLPMYRNRHHVLPDYRLGYGNDDIFCV